MHDNITLNLNKKVALLATYVNSGTDGMWFHYPVNWEKVFSGHENSSG